MMLASGGVSTDVLEGQDLISESKPAPERPGYRDHLENAVGGHHYHHDSSEERQNEQQQEGESKGHSARQSNGLQKKPTLHRAHDSQPLFRPTRRRLHLAVPSDNGSVSAAASISELSVNSQTMATNIARRLNGQNGLDDNDADFDDEDDQDILDLCFAGQHSAIGGGWDLAPSEERPLSDIALTWMLQQAKQAGIQFDSDKVRASKYFPDEPEPAPIDLKETPFLQIDGQPMPQSPQAERGIDVSTSTFSEEINEIATKSRVHDSLRYGGGPGWMSVAAWSLMEWLPFRRMDLQPDGSWRAISWPLPRGETRDTSQDCKIHHSVIKGLEADPTYRPGNLIVGGGGRGVRIAPKKYGTSKWKAIHEIGDAIGEACVKVIEGIEELGKHGLNSNGLETNGADKQS